MGVHCASACIALLGSLACIGLGCGSAFTEANQDGGATDGPRADVGADSGSSDAPSTGDDGGGPSDGGHRRRDGGPKGGDGGGPSDGGGPLDGPIGTFACGSAHCVDHLQYCYFDLSGGGAGSSGKCKAVPLACDMLTGMALCTCEGTAAGPGCTCTGMDGENTVTCGGSATGDAAVMPSDPIR